MEEINGGLFCFLLMLDTESITELIDARPELRDVRRDYYSNKANTRDAEQGCTTMGLGGLGARFVYSAFSNYYIKWQPELVQNIRKSSSWFPQVGSRLNFCIGGE